MFQVPESLSVQQEIAKNALVTGATTPDQAQKLAENIDGLTTDPQQVAQLQVLHESTEKRLQLMQETRKTADTDSMISALQKLNNVMDERLVTVPMPLKHSA